MEEGFDDDIEASDSVDADEVSAVDNPSIRPIAERAPPIAGRTDKMRFARVMGKILLFPLVSPLGSSRLIDCDGHVTQRKRPVPWRIANFLISRLLLSPIIAAVYFVILVYCTTHPARVRATNTPQTLDLYYQPVRISSGGGEQLFGWYIPALSSGEVLRDGLHALLRRRPAALLCHGAGVGDDYYLPLAKALHRAGFAVLLLDMRGQGRTIGSGVTFGLSEYRDVLSATEYLQTARGIDPSRVFVVGQGDGAVAALRAAAADGAIAGVVADDPTMMRRRLTRAFSAAGPAANAMVDGYALAFDLMMRRDVRSFDLRATLRRIRRPVLLLCRSNNVARLGPMLNAAAGVRDARLVRPDRLRQSPHAGRRITCRFLVKLARPPAASAISPAERRLLKARVQSRASL